MNHNLHYAVQYIITALKADELTPPDARSANGTHDALYSIYLGHQAGGIIGAQKSWVMVRSQNPELKALIEQSQALIHADDLKNLTMPSYLMAEYPIYSEAFNLIVGASGGGKSFVALDIAGRIALEKTVIYVAGEGLAGYAGRWEAWKNFHQVNTASLYFYKEALQMMDDQALINFVGILKQHNPYLIIIDTLARSAVGVDENSARDMGMFVHACDVMRAELQCGLIVVHHTGKSGDIRGSTALYGASDAVVSVSKLDGLVRVSNRQDHGGKNKYGEDNFEAWYKITPHSIDGFDGAILAPAEKLKDVALEINDKQASILFALSQFDEGVLVKELSSVMKLPVNSLYRNLNTLKNKQFVRKDHESWFIDDKGLQALETLGASDEHNAD